MLRTFTCAGAIDNLSIICVGVKILVVYILRKRDKLIYFFSHVLEKKEEQKEVKRSNALNYRDSFFKINLF